MPAESLSFRPSTALHAKLLHVALEGPAVESGASDTIRATTICVPAKNKPRHP
jgi:hypothetical protein